VKIISYSLPDLLDADDIFKVMGYKSHADRRFTVEDHLASEMSAVNVTVSPPRERAVVCFRKCRQLCVAY